MSFEISRFAGKPWWQMPILTAHRNHEQGIPAKGEYGGECARIACDGSAAHWFNETNGKYYCAACARTFNEVSHRNGQPPLCELHPPATTAA